MSYHAEIDQFDRALNASQWKDVDTIRIGAQPGFHSNCKVLVNKDDKPYLRVICFTDSTDYHFTSEVRVWHDWLVVGVGERLCLLQLTTRSASVMELGAYFVKLYTTTDMLLAASGENLHVINRDGLLIWSAEYLGIDGVLINRIEKNVIYGEGEWDPPIGWKPFKLDLNTGERIK